MHVTNNVNYCGDKSEIQLCEMIHSVITLNLSSIFCGERVLFPFKYKFYSPSYLPHSVSGKTFSKMIME